jgi:hypothetical protein
MAKKKVDWVPHPMIQFNLWQGNLISVLTDPANALIFNIPTAKQTTLLALQNEYETKYNVAPPHGDATKSARQARNDAQKDYISGVGGLRKTVAQYVRNNDLVSDGLKIELGVKVASLSHTPASLRAEVDYPSVQVKSNSPGTVTFTFHSKDSPSTRGKEAGMHHCLIEYIIGNTAPSSPDDCIKHIEPQKSPDTLNVGMAYSGQRIYGYACWVDTRGVKHYWSPVFSCIIT